MGDLPGQDPSTGSSGIYQDVIIPVTNCTAKLTFWWYPYTEDVGYDYQEALIMDTNNNILATIFSTDSNTQAWQLQTYDLTPFIGQTIRICFRVRHNGNDLATYMNIDDIALTYATPTRTYTYTKTCTGTQTYSVTATSTSTATNTRTGSNTPTPTGSSTETGTPTATPSGTGTITATVTGSPSATVSATATGSPSATASATAINTDTDSPTASATFTVTATPSATASATALPTMTMTSTSTCTATITGSTTNSPTLTSTMTPTPTTTPYIPDGSFGLNHNVFNPLKTGLAVSYHIPNQAHVSITVYSLVGTKVRTLLDADRPPGTWSLQWDGRNDQAEMVASDMYLIFCRLGNSSYLRKIAVLKEN